jgi:septum site-determining protein MinD
MAGYVCAVASGKGGVGKTTAATNVAATLEEDGYDVVVVDADLGMANLATMVNVESDVTIHEVLAGDATVSDALTDAGNGVTVIPGDQTLEAFADADPARLKTVTRTLRNTYDIVIVDTGAGISHETTVPLGLADGVVLVTTPDDVAVGDTVKTAELTDRVGGDVLGAVVNRAQAETDAEGIAGRLEVPLLAVVPDDVPATETEPLVLAASDSVAADAFRALTDRLVSVFFEAADPADLDTAVETTWFVDDEDEDEGEDEDEDEDEDGDSGRFGLFG